MSSAREVLTAQGLELARAAVSEAFDVLDREGVILVRPGSHESRRRLEEIARDAEAWTAAELIDALIDREPDDE